MRYILVILSAICSLANAQNSIKISGYVKDSANFEALISANIIVNQHNATTNNYGFYSIQVPKGKQSLQVSYVGYKVESIDLNLTSDTIVNIGLSSRNIIDEVIIKSQTNSQNRLLSNQTSLEVLSSKTVNKLPVIMGESDITRSLTLLPGISFGSENANGYYVRGGSSDQNLILMDGVPIYNAYHLYGYFSVFNTDAINQAKIYKGGAPAQYGGRLSSVLDLQMKEGNAQKYSGDITLGVVASKFLIEGPVFNEKTSFIITGRRSMIDLLPERSAWRFTDITGIGKANRNKDFDFFYSNNYLFGDLNAKVNHTFSSKSRLFFTYYKGTDKFENAVEFGSVNNFKKNNWGNSVISSRWNYIFNNDLFANFTIYTSSYNYQNLVEDYNTSGSEKKVKKLESRLLKLSGIEDYAAKADFDYNINNHNLKFGLQYLKQNIKPAINSFKQANNNAFSNIDTSYNFNKTLHSEVIYFEDNFKIFDKLSVNAGLHINNLQTDSKSYFSVQPRISFNYQLFERTALKLSYSRNSQALHQLISSSLGDPSDIWVPATRKIKPSISNDVVLGVHHNFNSSYSFTVEAYVKNMNNLIMYKPGASYLTKSNNWEDMVCSGIGKAKGIEFILNKETGNLTGWVSYSLSKSERKFELVNNNNWFPYTFDRRHNISIVLIQKLSKSFDLGCNWTYASGNAVTVANSFFYIENFGNGSFKTANSINNFRMPSYHRLDVCLNYNKSFKYFGTRLSVGAYNVYNNINPYQLLEGEEGLTVVGIFPILPYLSISVKF